MPSPGALRTGMGRPIVQVLFLASCLLSIVSFYTTQQGMALYLSPWFSMLAALGVQTALVMVAWLIGFTRSGRALLVAVYAITAVISIAFSYVSLHTWFSARERPALMQRALYDELSGAAQRAEQLLAEAESRGRRYVLALEEMAQAEKKHGRISRAQDADPFLDRIRQAVAKEAQTYDAAYREGAGEGVRYSAFDRYTKLTGETVRSVELSRGALTGWRSGARPTAPTEQQLRSFHAVYDPIPWAAVGELVGQPNLERPKAPEYAAFVESSASGQEDLMRGFEELFTAPGSRHVFALALATFIDVIVFLLAFASGPYFHGEPAHRWATAGAALDGRDPQSFARQLLGKVVAGERGVPRVGDADLTPGERQFLLLLVSQRMASVTEGGYLIDPEVHCSLAEAVASGDGPLLRAMAARPVA